MQCFSFDEFEPKLKTAECQYGKDQINHYDVSQHLSAYFYKLNCFPIFSKVSYFDLLIVTTTVCIAYLTSNFQNVRYLPYLNGILSNGRLKQCCIHLQRLQTNKNQRFAVRISQILCLMFFVCFFGGLIFSGHLC